MKNSLLLNHEEEDVFTVPLKKQGHKPEIFVNLFEIQEECCVVGNSGIKFSWMSSAAKFRIWWRRWRAGMEVEVEEPFIIDLDTSASE